MKFKPDKMTASMLLWALLATAIFWSVGVYNRLMRMRAKGLEALDAVLKYLQRYEALVQAQMAAVLHDMADEWSGLKIALLSLNAACSRAKLSSLGTEELQVLAAHYQELQHAWAVLCESPADLAGHRMPEGLQVEWERVSQKVMHARNKYHQIATEYNAALTQFPAILLVRIAGFKPAGTL